MRLEDAQQKLKMFFFLSCETDGLKGLFELFQKEDICQIVGGEFLDAVITVVQHIHAGDFLQEIMLETIQMGGFDRLIKSDRWSRDRDVIMRNELIRLFSAELEEK